jgi:hypothetical protein
VSIYDVSREVGYRFVSSIVDEVAARSDTSRRRAVFLSNRIFLPSDQGAVNLYNTVAKHRIRSFAAPTGCTDSNCVFVDPAQPDLLSVGYVHGGVALFSVATGTLLRHIPLSERVYSTEVCVWFFQITTLQISCATQVFFSPTRVPMLAVATADGAVAAYDLRSSAAVCSVDTVRLTHHHQPLSPFSSDPCICAGRVRTRVGSDRGACAAAWQRSDVLWQLGSCVCAQSA